MLDIFLPESNNKNIGASLGVILPLGVVAVIIAVVVTVFIVKYLKRRKSKGNVFHFCYL